MIRAFHLKKVSIPARYLLAVSATCFVFCVGIFLKTDVLGLAVILPLSASALYVGWSNPLLFLTGFFALLPLLGFLNVVMVLPAVPVLLPVFWAGLSGRLLIHWGDKTRFVLREELVVYVAGLTLSFFVALASFWNFYPVFNAVVSSSPWGPVHLKNALGWTGLSFSLALSGVFMFIWLVSDRINLIGLLEWCLRGMAVASVVGLLQCLGFQSLAGFKTFLERGFFQYNATFQNPNVAGLLSALLFPLWLAQVAKKNTPKTVEVSGLCLLFLLVISGVRSAYLVLAVAMALFLLKIILSGNRRVQKTMAAALVLLVGFVFYQIKYDPLSRLGFLVRHALDTVGSPYAFALSVVGDRAHLWKSGWVTFQHNKIFGTGIGNYLIKMPAYANELDVVTNDNCGNMYLHLAAEQGMVGFVVFCSLLGSFLIGFLRKGFRRASLLGVGAFCSLTSLCAAFFFGCHLLSFEVNLMFWFLLAVLSNEPGAPRVA